MNMLLKKSFLPFAVAVTINYAESQTKANSALADNDLTIPLAYFEKTAQEPEVKKAVEQAEGLYNTGVLNDSLAAALINMEDLLNFRLDEYFFLNYKPYNAEMLFTLYQRTASLLQSLAPRDESLYYASALHRFALMIWRCAELNEHSLYNPDSLMEIAFSIRERKLGNKDPDYIEGLYGKALTYHPLENEEAVPLLQDVINLSAAGEGKGKKICADALLQLGRIYTGQHRYSEAARILEKENEVRKELLGAESASYALRSYATGDLILYTGEYQTSLVYFNRALELTRKTLGEENLQYAFCLDGVGSVYYHIGDYREAVPYYIQALSIKQKLGDYYGLPLAYHQLATTYVRMGLYAQAQPLFEEGCAIVEKSYEQERKGADGYGYFLTHLANVYRTTHQYAKAYPLLRKAADLTSPGNGGSDFFHSVCLQNLASLFQNTGRYDSALFYLKEVLLLKEKKWGKEHFQYASTLHELSALYAKLNRPDSALLLCKQAACIRADKLGKEHAEYTASLALMGDLYTGFHQFDSAQNYLQQALLIREKTLGPNHPDYVKNLYSLGKLALVTGEAKKAAELLIRADSLWLQHLKQTYASLSEQEKINLVNSESDVFNYLPSMLCKGHQLAGVVQQVYSDELLLKGMVLDEQQQVLNAIRRCKDSVAAALYLSWRTNRATLAKQYFLPLKERLSSFDSIRRETDNLEEKLSRRSGFFQQQRTLQNVTVKDIGNTLQKGQAAIEFIRFHYQYPKETDSIIYAAIVVLPGDTTGAFVPLFEESQLLVLLQSSTLGEPWVIKKLYPGSGQDFSGNHPSLYQLIWQPLEKYLSGVNTVYYAPAGLLYRTAFAALRTSGGQLLIDKYRLNRVFSTRSLILSRPSSKPPHSVSIWGSMAYSTPTKQDVIAMYGVRRSAGEAGKLKRLAGAQTEIKSIEAFCATAGISAKIVSGEKATEEEFKKLDGRSPDIIHIATHGFFVPEKWSQLNKADLNESNLFLVNAMLGSSLLMAKSKAVKKADHSQAEEDGILTAYEIAQMDLSKTRLMVLSACNTALGDLQGEEGVMGLQRALKLAGVKQMVISLWKVPDRETTKLMRLFYQAFMNGKDAREALRIAQLKMKQKYPPYYWGAFVLVE